MARPLSSIVLLGFWMLLTVGCETRDNPWDPINRLPTPISLPPEPGPTRIVVDPDRAGRGSPWFGNIHSALAVMEPGDTVWILGPRTFEIWNPLYLVNGGRSDAPLVVRTWGGEVRITPARQGLSALLRVEGEGHLELRGLALTGSDGVGLRVNSLSGPLRLDSCRIDSNTQGGIELITITHDTVTLRQVRLRHNGAPAILRVSAPFLDTADVEVIGPARAAP